MVRIALLMWLPAYLALTLAFAPDASATEQYAERISIAGRAYELHSLPLEQLLATRRDRPDVLTPSITALRRGYIGHWRIQGRRLYLDRLERIAVDRSTGAETRIAIPVSEVDPARQFRSPARWFTGTLRVPDGLLLRRAHGESASVHERMRIVTVVRGAVTRCRVISPWTLAVAQSDRDLSWSGLRIQPDRTDARWTDGRLLVHARHGELVRTRGVFVGSAAGAPGYLWIPETPSTLEVKIPFTSPPLQAGASHWPHIEVRAQVIRDSAGLRLRPRAAETLARGVSMHHPSFTISARRSSVLLETWVRRLRASPELLEADGALDAYLGALIELWGVPERQGCVSLIRGVEVHRGAASGPEREESAVGVLRKWIVTAAMIRRCPTRFAAFRTRGPGVYWQLVCPETGKLAETRP